MSAKSTTKQQQKSRAELHRELARNISDAIKNPTIPPVLYNAITEGITDLFNAIPGVKLDASVDYISSLLDLHAEAQGEGEVR
jgi:hypothetical protein